FFSAKTIEHFLLLCTPGAFTQSISGYSTTPDWASVHRRQSAFLRSIMFDPAPPADSSIRHKNHTERSCNIYAYRVVNKRVCRVLQGPRGGQDKYSCQHQRLVGQASCWNSSSTSMLIKSRATQCLPCAQKNRA
ncbi:unnamed protein product, partial [Ectocarpus sp. 13 AM-2016]